VDAFENRNFRGTVKQVRLNPTTVSNVVTYDVVINVDNPEKILLPGMTAYVNITVAERKNTLMVPNAALRYKPANAVPAAKAGSNAGKNGGTTGSKVKHDAFSGKVYILENGKLKAINVTFGITDNRNTEIVSGDLKAGDQVVIGEVQPADQSQNATGRPMRLF
jgi:HlyD family secretion protein